ncbi:MAG: hypothetical protein ABR881_00030 [Candidatus Sulfotelmatobacter sp.]
MTGAFCNKCGARAVLPGASTAQPVAPYAPPSPVQGAVQPASQSAGAAKNSGLGKVLAIVGGVLLLLFVIAVGAGVYGVYWVKHKVTAYSSAVTGGSSEPIKVEKGDSCRLLSTEELQQVLGVTVEKSAEIVEGSTPGCAYYTNPQAFAQLQRMAAEQARRQTEAVNNRPGPKDDNLGALLKDTNQMEGIVKTLGLTQPVQDGRVFAFTVQRDSGRNSWSGARLAESVVPGFEEVPGVGDHAMIGSFGHAFYLLKGDAMIYMETTWVPDARTRGAEIGKKIMGNL